jgi:hypothetical protein
MYQMKKGLFFSEFSGGIAATENLLKWREIDRSSTCCQHSRFFTKRYPGAYWKTNDEKMK